MKINFSKWTINQKLALFAFLLGFAAIFLKDPTKATISTIDTKDLALKILDKSNNIKVDELAGWIIEKKEDFKLVDLRDEQAFKEYNIPGAINLNASEILKATLSKTQKIVLYSDDNMISSQTWVLLKSKNYNAVYILDGGMKEWKNRILFPSISENATPEEKAKFNIMAEISKYFGGSPRTLAQGGQTVEVVTQKVMPKVAPPSSASKPLGGKGKREGC